MPWIRGRLESRSVGGLPRDLRRTKLGAVTERLSPADQRVWGLRALGVLQAPHRAFQAFRADDEHVADARQETATALVLLAGCGAVLAAPQTGRLLDDFTVDDLVLPFLVLLTGFFYGVAGYWIGGALLLLGERLAGGAGGYRRTRHFLAFAAAPLALSLVVYWPLRIALYGEDLFRTSGPDGGTTGTLLAWLWVLFVAWSLVLVVIGLRAVHSWSRLRALAASLPLLAVVLGLLAAAFLSER